MKKILGTVFLLTALITITFAQGTRLLRQPTLSKTYVAFEYGGDIWTTNLQTKQTLRITSTPAVESNPHFSPDGKTIAFSSNRSGVTSVYIVPATGGSPTRLTWYPSSSIARGWTPDGKNVLYSSFRETAPAAYARLWTVPKTGGPSKLLMKQWGADGSFSADGKQIVIDRVSRWDVEWRDYRGGQNTPLIIVNLNDLSEELLPNKKQTDTHPLWLGETIYFLSDRDWVKNIWSFNSKTKELKQVTKFKGADIKWIAGHGNKIIFEREGYLNVLNLDSNKTTQLNITINGDFPWAETKWKDVTGSAKSASLSPTGKRVIMESRGEIFTIPVEHGNVRNITKSSGVADRVPLWSPKGDKLAWFSDQGGNGYSLMIGEQDGFSKPRSIEIGESKMAWEPTWSPNGKYIAFTDDDVRIRVVDLEKGTIKTIDVGGNNLERGSLGLTWSPDSKWLAYAKSAANNFRQITIWSVENNSIKKVTNTFADAFSPAWDSDKKHLYFLASTDLALGSGWANTSAMTAKPKYSVYVVNLQAGEASPFKLRSDEEKKTEEKKSDKKDKKKQLNGDTKKKDNEKSDEKTKKEELVKIDFEGIDIRTIALPMPKSSYRGIVTGPKGTAFILENKPGKPGLTLQKFTIKERKAKEFVGGVSSVSVSNDGKKMLARVGSSWKVMDTAKPSGKDGKTVKVTLKMKLDREQEWKQIFEETWRYERDYFYDPGMHGRNWDKVYKRYAPLVPFIKHRTDLTYILDQVNGELSVGHSFVGGGDFPSVERNMVGVLGADLKAENNHWKIERIYTTESWNPELSSPLEEPGLKVKKGNYLVGVNGEELTTDEDPYKLLDGTLGLQTVLHISNSANFDSAWTITVKPIRSESALRQRAWVEDNRRLVDSISGGKIAYVWIPNTSGPGFVSFNRYFFAQQDKLGAVIDERFNGGGLLDDYMVDLMTRKLRAALTNEVPNGKPMRLPAGILGPKVLLINEKSGSGGDFFPWVFRQQKAGPLIGSTTWGGLVKSSVHYRLVDGGTVTAPDNAVFDPVNHKWVAENHGVPPDIAVRQDAISLSKGTDPQLERAVKEVLKLVNKENRIDIVPPPFSQPAIRK